MITVLGVYLYILVGFVAKKIFREIEGKSLVLLSTYFLQPFLTLWGILLIPLNKELILSPLIYILAVFISFIFTFFISLSLKDKKEKIISSIAPLIGNTGNLGIPLSYALFGDIGASVATLVNLANVFFIYTFGIFFYASGEYFFRESFKKIIKIPIIWFGILALGLNVLGVKFDKDVMKILQMGAFASIVTQLLIFGIYVAEIKLKEVSLKLSLIVLFNKFLVLPFITYFILFFFKIDPVIKKVIVLEVLTPLAVTNVNLSALFNIYPQKMAFLIILTSILFIPITLFFL